MEYIDGSAPLSEQEVEDLNDLPSGSVPVKTEGGFGQATLANVPDSTAGDGRKAVTTTESAAVAALTPEVTDILAVANLRLKDATLTDADATVSPGVSKVALYELPAETLSANRAVRVAISGMVAGQPAVFVRRDRSAYTLTIIDDVTGLAVFVFGASPTGDDVATVQFDGVQIRYGVTARLS